MNKKLEWLIIILLTVILVGLSACSPSPHVDKQPPHETEQEMNAEITKDMEAMDREKAQAENPQPADFESIVDALGCMFDPSDCPLKKSKEEQKMDR
jgi:septal ring-binding cell division protein DamX